jgi:hypothetical protein
MVAWAFPPVAVPIVGVDGGVPITRELLDEEATDSTPLDEIAVIVKVTVLPAVKPVT